MYHRSFLVRLAVGMLLAVLAAGAAQAYHGDPPSRVARLSYLRGEVSFAPAGESEWVRAYLNRPLIRGDRLWTDRRGRAELQVGGAAFRIDEYSAVGLLNLDDRIAQLEVTQGSVNLRVRRLYRDQEYEISTPLLALVVTTPGSFRVDVDDRGEYVDVVVWDGEAIAYGDNARFPVREGEAVRFYDARLRDYEIYDLPREDAFDAFCFDRDRRLDRSVSLRYLSEDVIGYSDLDEYGSWAPVREYGTVWFPRHVDAGWAPYRDGHWAWIEPWGWTWVDEAPWGFAPFHYGRWVLVTGRWGWVPAPRLERVVYAPALVAFIGGSGFSLSVSVGEPIGWFPLGPRDVYIPPYYASRDYFTRINVTNTVIQNNYITNVYNNYYVNDRPTVGIDYVNRRHADAITAVPRDVFTSGRPVDRSLLRVDQRQTARAEVMRMAAVAPTQRSLVGATPVATARPTRDVLERGVIARNQPGEVVAPFATRTQALQRTPGRPLRDEVERTLGRGRGRDVDTAANVRVVAPSAPMAQRRAERVEDRPMPRGVDVRGRDAELPARGVEGERVEREPARDPVDAPRGRGVDPARGAREAERAERELEREPRERGVGLARDAREAERAERELEREPRGRGVDRQAVEPQRQAEFERQREAERAQRDAERQQRRVERDLEDQRQRQVDLDRQREVERQQREVERQQRFEQERQRDVERQQRAVEQQRQFEQVERQRQAEEQQRRQAEQFERQRQREAEMEQRRAEQVERQRAVEREQREAEQAQRRAEQFERQRQMEQQQREAEQFERQRRAQDEQQRREQALYERQQRQQQEQERQQRAAELYQQRQQEQYQRQLEQQQRQQEQWQRQQEAQQRAAEQYQREQQQRQQEQPPPAEEDQESHGRGRGRGRDRDDGGW